MLHKQAISEVPKALTFQASEAKFKLLFFDNEFSLHENIKSFSSKSFRFETEAWSNSEMAD